MSQWGFDALNPQFSSFECVSSIDVCKPIINTLNSGKMLSCLHSEGQFGVLGDDIIIIVLINFSICVNTALPLDFLGANWMYATTTCAFGRWRTTERQWLSFSYLSKASQPDGNHSSRVSLLGYTPQIRCVFTPSIYHARATCVHLYMCHRCFCLAWFPEE